MFELKTQPPTLIEIKLEYGEDYLLAYLELWIVEIIEVGGVESSIKTGRYNEAIRIAFKPYYHVLNLADLKLLYEQISRRELVGDKESFFLKLNAGTLSHWVKTYVRNRLSTADEVSYNESCKYKESGVRDNELSKLGDVWRTKQKKQI